MRKVSLMLMYQMLDDTFKEWVGEILTTQFVEINIIFLLIFNSCHVEANSKG